MKDTQQDEKQPVKTDEKDKPDLTEVIELIKYYVPVRQHAQIIIDKLKGVAIKQSVECVHPFESLLISSSKATCLKCGKEV